MRALPQISSRLAHNLRRVAAVLCLLLALNSWLDGQHRTPSTSRTELALPAGDRATSVPVFADAARLVHTGDSVDLVAPDRPGDGASDESVIARGARVLSVHRAPGGFGSTSDVANLVVATNPAAAVRIAAALHRGPFAVIVGSS